MILLGRELTPLEWWALLAVELVTFLATLALVVFVLVLVRREWRLTRQDEERVRDVAERLEPGPATPTGGPWRAARPSPPARSVPEQPTREDRP